MTSKLAMRTIWLAVNINQFDRSVIDFLTSQAPATWRKNPTRINIGVFESVDGDPMDLSDVKEIRVTGKLEKTDAANFIWSHITSVANATITRADWSARSTFHASVVISGDELDLTPASGSDAVEAYITVTAIVFPDCEHTLEAGSMLIHEDYNATAATVVGDRRVDYSFGPVFSDGVGWCQASGAPVDAHELPEPNADYERPVNPSLGQFAWNEQTNIAEWYDGVGWGNETGGSTDGHELPEPDSSYVRPAYPGENTMEFDSNLILPLWRIGEGWINATQGVVE